MENRNYGIPPIIILALVLMLASGCLVVSFLLEAEAAGSSSILISLI